MKTAFGPQETKALNFYWHKRMASLLTAVALISACVPGRYEAAKRNGIVDLARPIASESAIGSIRRATAGDTMYEYSLGETYEVESLVLMSEVKQRIGRYRVEIAATELPLSFQTASHLFYACPSSAIKAATATMAASNEITCVGIKENKQSGALSWFIDSLYREYVERVSGDPTSIDVERSKVLVAAIPQDALKLIYLGFSEDLIRLEMRETRAGIEATPRTLNFEIGDDGGPTKFAVKGVEVEVLAIDNLGVDYRIVKTVTLK